MPETPGMFWRMRLVVVARVPAKEMAAARALVMRRVMVPEKVRVAVSAFVVCFVVVPAKFRVAVRAFWKAWPVAREPTNERVAAVRVRAVRLAVAPEKESVAVSGRVMARLGVEPTNERTPLRAFC